MLSVEGLKVGVNGKVILNGVTLTFEPGRVYALMGPNGSGKSTLSYAIMGHPEYSVIEGDIKFMGQSIVGLKPNERARLGIFLAFQNPVEIPGVQALSFIKAAYNSITGQNLSTYSFNKLVKSKISELGLDESLLQRPVNDGLSGGERKRLEVIQMAVLQPKIAILDEIDSGLDVDQLERISNALNVMNKKYGTALVLVTHYTRILKYVRPESVYVMHSGRIVTSGGPELAERIDSEGYGWLGIETA